MRELKSDSRLGLAKLDVVVFDGVVTLTGIVTSYSKKLAAQEAAFVWMALWTWPMTSVLCRIVSSCRTDADIAHAVRHVLEWDALVPDERIKSTVSNGWVTIEGDVEFWHEREEAERAVLRLEGVIGVINKILVTAHQVDPEELREEINTSLERRADREAERLRIEVNEGEGGSLGRVHSWQEKRAVPARSAMHRACAPSGITCG